MSGFQEILVIALLVAVIFILPRRLGRQRNSGRSAGVPATLKALSGRIRLALLLSLIWIASASFYWRPWQGEPLPFLTIGVAPIVVCWGLIWVLAGFRK